MYGLLRASVFAKHCSPRASLLTRGFKKQNKVQQPTDEDDESSQSGDADPAYAEFMKYWRLPEKPEILKRTPEQYMQDKEYLKRWAKIRQEEDVAYQRLFALKQLHSWDAIFELPPRLFRDAVVIDHTVIPTYQPWMDTPPDPNFKLSAKPPELPS